MKAFALKAQGNPVKDIEIEELAELRRKFEAFFVLVESNEESTAVTSFTNTAKAFFAKSHFFHIRAVELAKPLLGIQSAPAVVVVKDGSQKVYDKDLADEAALKAWILKERFPALVTLDDDNARDILLGDKYVVLGMLEPNLARFSTYRDALNDAAKLFVKRREKNSVYIKPGRDVAWAWLDVSKWSNYAERAFNVKASDVPTIVIVDAKDDEYFDVDLEGRRFGYEDPERLIRIVEDVQRDVLHGKSTLGAIAGWIKSGVKTANKVGEAASRNPTVTFIGIAAVIGLFVWYVRRSGSRGYQAVGTKIE